MMLKYLLSSHMWHRSARHSEESTILAVISYESLRILSVRRCLALQWKVLFHNAGHSAGVCLEQGIITVLFANGSMLSLNAVNAQSQLDRTSSNASEQIGSGLVACWWQVGDVLGAA